MPPTQHDVLGLDVAMHDAVLVGERQRIGDVKEDPDDVVDRQRRRAFEASPKRLALDQRHDEEDRISGLARIEHRDDVRMLELSGEGDFPEEAFART